MSQVSQYLMTYSDQLAEKIQENFSPLHAKGERDLELAQLKRQLIGGQYDAVAAAVKLMDSGEKTCNLIGELGTGKTICSIAAIQSHAAGRKYRAIIMCPPHLVEKWCREVRMTLPKARPRIIEKYRDLEELAKCRAKPLNEEYWVVSESMSKLGSGWKPAVIKSRLHPGYYVCPHCREPLKERDMGGEEIGPVEIETLDRRRISCEDCSTLVLELQPPESLPTHSRIWSDATGQHEIAARLVAIKVGFALLEKADGSKLSVPLNKLSEADQIFALQVAAKRVNPKAQVILAKVVNILDGDTLRVANAIESVKTIRLNGVDAPEKGQEFADEAIAWTKKLLGHEVRVEYTGKDRYNRLLGDVYDGDGRWINREIVADGLAWQYKDYSKDERLAKAEDLARAQKLGVWSEESRIAPWDYRNGVREKAEEVVDAPSTRTTDVTVYITETGTHYHREGCRHLSKSKIPIPLSRAVSAYEALQAM